MRPIWEELGKSFERSAAKYLKPYNKVLVRLVYFKQAEKEFEKETERFEKFLRKDFGYTTHRSGIRQE
jgi:hypothetical protein